MGASIDSRVNSAVSQAVDLGMLADTDSVMRTKRWLHRMAQPNLVDLRSNATRDYSYDRVTKMFLGLLDKHASSVPAEIREHFMEVERGAIEKMGSKSIYKGYYEDGPDKLLAVCSPKAIPKTFDRKAGMRALERMVSEISPNSISWDSIADVLSRESSAIEEFMIDGPVLNYTTNSGLPWNMAGWKPRPDMPENRRLETTRVFQWIQKRAEQALRDLSAARAVTWYVMVSQRIVNRGRNPLDDPKTKRLVMALEKAEPVIWKLFLFKVMERHRANRTPIGNCSNAAWMDAPFVDYDCQIVMSDADKLGLPVLSGDVSNFDQSVVPELWEMMSDAMSVWHGRNAPAYKALNRSDIYHCRVLSPTGVIDSGPSSIKSGSGGTNYNDSQYNRWALYLGEEMGLYKLRGYGFQGDDFFATGYGVEPDAIAFAYGCLNLSVSPDKQDFGYKRLAYLQRTHYLGHLGGVASIGRVLNSCLVYESMPYSSRDWNWAMEALQLISKLENAVFNPLFHELVDMVKGMDKYRLGASHTPEAVIKKAGNKAEELLARDGAVSIQARTATGTSQGFARSAVNGVLRGERMPPWGTSLRFVRAYGQDRIERAGQP